ncbi:tyrosine recombinase XerC [Clostridium tetani]|uniref:Putative integrase, recombinase n=1 Tax=Clostridium tetani (strain Massachusetts / E88) TaxID=212717 RepID=Q895H8_CLOTE|nr:tyrosine recombinase XerC [Clostridium tetani]AAO35862.1 putative integrase, recombinase [Clostridium tetani E88]AVP53758.1 tyrosine recombinase XerC [Clostridium tetani]KGI38231.1 recombinase XerC [Clostridium tetani]KGI42679.1 recombinase XerC [Clostridium tetani]KHO33382.1 recombinase XerC [Clostridium tetani]
MYKLKNIYDPELPQQLNNFLNYLTTVKERSPNTMSAYKVDLVMFFRFLKLYKTKLPKDIEFDDIDISDIDDEFIRKITLTDLYSFMAFLDNYRDNGSYAKARKVATLKSFFKFLYSKVKILEENPAIELESPKIKKRNPTYLTLEESKRLLASIDGTNKARDYCIITLFLNCGLRLSELCSIDISKIKEDTLYVIGKGNKERTIYLNKACLKAVEDYLKVRNKNLDKIKDKDALFISRNNTRINKRTVEIMLKKYLKKANLDEEKYTPHKLRHTAATLMYKHGDVDIRSLQKILGHENISTTQIYTHVDNEKLREAVKLNPLSGESME